MLKYPLFPAVAGSRRRKILAPLAAIALFGSMMLLPGPAGALPPPDDSSGSKPRSIEVITLRATSYLGTVPTYDGLSATRAMQPAPVYLSGTNTNGRQPVLRVTESSWCDGGSRYVTVTADHAGGYAVPDPTSRCGGDGLYQAMVTAVAFDPVLNGRSTGQLTIDVYGWQFPDDRLPIFGPW
jgi:hypothetical protein